MDIIKIGKFISKKRKEINLTQLELADKLYVTDRAVSKWECGKSLPDSSILIELCKILNISIEELFAGEELNVGEKNKELEKSFFLLLKEKEKTDKKLLQIEIGVGVPVTIFIVSMILVAGLGYDYLDLPLWATIFMIVIAFLLFVAVVILLLLIEQKAGYYECQNCKYRYVPTYKQILLAPHINRSRYMKCPHCGKKTYNKKVLTKEQK